MSARRLWFGLLGTLVLARLPASAGAQAIGSEFQVNTYTTGSQFRSSVASDASGNFVVVWEGGPAGGDYDGVFGQRYDSAGVAQGDEFAVSSNTTSDSESASVAAAADGDFVVVWTRNSRPDAFTPTNVFGQRYDSEGMARGDEFQVNSYTTDDQRGGRVALRAETSSWFGKGRG